MRRTNLIATLATQLRILTFVAHTATLVVALQGEEVQSIAVPAVADPHMVVVAMHPIIRISASIRMSHLPSRTNPLHSTRAMPQPNLQIQPEQRAHLDRLQIIRSHKSMASRRQPR